jgi:hypothetical protein
VKAWSTRRRPCSARPCRACPGTARRDRGLLLATLLSRWPRLGAQGAQGPIAALLMLLLARSPTPYAESLLAEGVIGALVAARGC